MFCITSFIFIVIASVASVKVTLLPPVRNGTDDVAIIVTPGAEIDGLAYQPLAQAIQAQFPGRLWIALLHDFLLKTPNPPELSEGVNLAKASLQKDGFHGDSFFLAGHSLGGVFVADYGLSNSSALLGVLLWASYLTRPRLLRDYPVPLLTISGDIDGLTRITRIVDTFEELENETVNNPRPTSIMYTDPVIVMPGINHGHFAAGTMPPNVVKHDPPADSDVTPNSAHDTIAWHVTNFLIVTLGQPTEMRLVAFAGLKSAFFQTKNIIQPLSTVKSLDQNTMKVSDSTQRCQILFAGPALANRTQVTDSEISEVEVPFSDPKVYVHDMLAHAQTYTHVVMPFDPVDVSLYPQTPKELQALMVSQDGLHRHMPDIPFEKNNLTCKDANMMLYSLALNKSSTEARQRFTERGSTIKFNDDIVSVSKVTWALSDLDVVYGKNGHLEVTSKTIVSGNTGLQFCKLLSPYRAMEWIYIDSLKRNS
ncbi:uncharacterized protein LOC127871066 [Dreissena polymorpha]|uniref:Alpha/beta hydrolase fold-5 domain-containing protein n=1 Tax=Dreissena polymorpha TaxID=45954 RepID=A0A9D4MIM1_DREPO|nr:uncharacterized protein LOC127871066 [Dreissena polymorpha]KAH3877193.1 hypothetical protein DPMN_001052 [Dreissena polymorpha]